MDGGVSLQVVESDGEYGGYRETDDYPNDGVDDAEGEEPPWTADSVVSRAWHLPSCC